MLTSDVAHRAARGVTLIELMVGLAITALLMLMAAPSIGEWIGNSKVRASAESILNGLQYSKGEAVSRNARVRFQLTTSVDDSCAIDAGGTSWVVNLDPNNQPDAVANECAQHVDPDDPIHILQRRPAAEGSVGVQVQGSAATIVFNGLGRPIMNPPATVTFDVTNPNAGTCAADGGSVVCLRIVVSPQGQIRMCNPHMNTVNPSDPQAC